MHTIDVNTGRPYRVHVGTFLLERVGETCREVAGGERACIVTDTNVGPLYANPVRQGLAEAGYEVDIFTFEAGEANKRAGTYISILEFLAERAYTRSDVVVALGGGVTGDMAGFAAATYMRGCAYVQVPTSLLAMVDSSVGGKCAIDLSSGKNLAGAFWQPAAVLADIGCLATLDDAQFADGCGEVVKHAAIADPDLFCALERTPLTPELLRENVPLVEELVARNIDIKRAVVEMDERETQARKLLNFGHSIGHAVEASENYRLGHGTCVAIGMTAISRAAAALGACDTTVPERIETACAAHGLTTRTERTLDDIFDAALHDKKRHGDTIDVVIPRRIGACSIETVSLATFRDLIAEGIGAKGK